MDEEDARTNEGGMMDGKRTMVSLSNGRWMDGGMADGSSESWSGWAGETFPENDDDRGADRTRAACRGWLAIGKPVGEGRCEPATGH